MKAQIKKDPRVDQYIKEAQPFARPILKKLRKIVQETCPQTEETLKWDSPFYIYNGKILCGMGTFKNHCKFWIKNWKSMTDESEAAKFAMKQMLHIATISDLPNSTLLKSLLKKSMKLHDAGIKPVKRVIQKKPPVKTPPELLRALRAVPKALAVYKEFAPSNQRHYVDWITDAKTDETREKRLAQAIKCIAAGKTKHWQ